MEVGAIKQAFNNEIILLKKNLNQARIQIIHKLTRKAKTLTEKKAPEKNKLKLKKKAESAVNEVLIIKKIKAKELAKFIVTHTSDLNKYLNKREVDNEKACARLLLHKSLQDKYKIIRTRFSDIPIKDLFMSRQERRNLKKEAKEKQTNKKKGKDKPDISNIVNNNKLDNNDTDVKNNISNDDDKGPSDEGTSTDDKNEFSSNENKFQESENESESNANDNDKEYKDESDDDNETVGRFVRLNPIENKKPLPSKVRSLIDETANKNYVKPSPQQLIDKVKDSEKKLSDNKNKNLKEKLLSRNFKKTLDVPVAEKKVVDPFFITSTGESYMSVAEPRQPDEIKDIHKTGNRKERRAAMFGRKFEVKSKFSDKNKFSTNFSSKSNNNKLNYKNSHIDFTNYNNDKNNFKDRNNRFSKSNEVDKNSGVKDKQEKLHPSWEAKKKQSSILPFQGKKIVFDEN